MTLAKDLGLLVLVVGPSGAGKDSLIDGAKRALAGDPSIHFARRVITRREASGEDHDISTERAFEAAERAGAFLLSWRAHGLAYGIPADVQHLRSTGITVVANASRAVVDEARRRLAPVRVILVTAPPQILAARLKARGRESGDEFGERLARSAMTLPAGTDAIELVNDGTIEGGVAAFVSALKRMCAQAI